MQNKKMDPSVSNFLQEVLVEDGGKDLIKFFEEKKEELNFEGINSKALEYIVSKSLHPNYNFLIPLSNYLIDNKYCTVGGELTQFALLNGLKMEQLLKNLETTQNNLNETMKDYHFEEKMIITNQPAKQIYELAKKIINNSSEEVYSNVKSMLEDANIDFSTSDLMKRKKASSSLRM